MSWISQEHEKIYGKALSALYKDISTISANVADKTGKLVSNSYGVVSKMYQEWTHDSDSDDTSETNQTESSSEPRETTDQTEIPETTEIPDDKDDIKNNNKDMIVVKFHQHEYIAKIYIRDSNGRHKTIVGRLSSNKDVDYIVNTWFVYENRSDQNEPTSNDPTGHKWYPSEKLYNYYQKNNIKITIPIDMAIFSYKNGKYVPT